MTKSWHEIFGGEVNFYIIVLYYTAIMTQFIVFLMWDFIIIKWVMYYLMSTINTH